MLEVREILEKIWNKTWVRDKAESRCLVGGGGDTDVPQPPNSFPETTGVPKKDIRELRKKGAADLAAPGPAKGKRAVQAPWDRAWNQWGGKTATFPKAKVSPGEVSTVLKDAYSLLP